MQRREAPESNRASSVNFAARKTSNISSNKTSYTTSVAIISNDFKCYWPLAQGQPGKAKIDQRSID